MYVLVQDRNIGVVGCVLHWLSSPTVDATYRCLGIFEGQHRLYGRSTHILNAIDGGI